MKNFHPFTFFVIGLLMTNVSLAQDDFLKGYLVNKKMDTIRIEIEEIEKENTPDYFKFRYEGEQDVYNTNDVKLKEIGFDAGRKFIFQVAEIDCYFTKDLSKLTGSRALVTKAEELFLELIADGEIRLAKYKKGDLERFYYQNENKRFVLLIQNYYVVNDKLMENDTYRFQLKSLVSEANFESSKFNRVSYKESSILQLIKDYYVATNQEAPSLNLKKKNT